MTISRLGRSLSLLTILLVTSNEAFAQRRGGMVANRGPVGRPSFSSAAARPAQANFNRPNINTANINRANVNANTFNRANVNNVNRTNVNVNNNRVNNTVVNNNVINNNVNVNNRTNNFVGGNRGYAGGWGGYGGGYRPNPYSAYHSNWVNGSWNSNYVRSSWGGYRGYGGYVGGYGGYGGYGNYYGGFGNSALGIGTGIGVAAWGLASLSNSWGYSRYANPYYSTVVVQQPTIIASSAYDYSRPLDLSAAPPAEPVVQQAVATLTTARTAFYTGDYPQALKLADQALTETPNDPMLHEFRAICLFAMGRYDEAAIPLYTVLSSGPGWDWTTLCGLYADAETYTRQLRTLEAFCNNTPRAASARFVLAALYLTQGSSEAAAKKFREVVAIQPQDKLSAQLASALMPDPSAPPSTVASQPPAATAATGQPPADPTPVGAAAAAEPALPTGPVPTRLVGSWTASPAKDVSITLAFVPEKGFTWKVTDRGQTRELQGPANFDNDTLALLAADQPPMVAKLTFKDDGHFHFKPVGAPAEDPGLDFSK